MMPKKMLEMKGWKFATCFLAFSILYLFAPMAHSQEKECCFVYKDRCLKKATRFLDAETIQQKREFFIYYNQSEKDNDRNCKMIAECGYTSGTYSCRGSKGFHVDKQPSQNFTIIVDDSVYCVTSGQFIFDEAFQQYFRCTISFDASNQLNSTNKDTGEKNTDFLGLAIGIGTCGVLFLVIIGIWILWKRRNPTMATNIC